VVLADDDALDVGEDLVPGLLDLRHGLSQRSAVRGQRRWDGHWGGLGDGPRGVGRCQGIVRPLCLFSSRRPRLFSRGRASGRRPTRS
jgi:hypothetical protein